MPWFRVDDNLHGHHKPRKAGLAAMGLWSLAGSYAAAYLTEGFVPRWYVESWKNGSRLAHNLVDSGLWEVAELDGEEGWIFHQWEERQPTKSEVEAERKATRERQKRWRAKKNAELTDVTPAVTNGVSNAVTNGVSNAAHSLPLPSTPRRTSTSAQKRGQRIPEDFAVTPEMVAWAKENTPGVNGKLETDKFIDHWRAKTGRDATKLDWVGTWRNWMRNATTRPIDIRSGPSSNKPNRAGYTMLEPPRDIVDDPDAVRAFHRASLDAWDKAHA